MIKLSKLYWVAWWEKFFSLFVSAKMVLFWGTMILNTILLMYGYIDKSIWSSIAKISIVTIAGMRGMVQIAEVVKRPKNNNQDHEEQQNVPNNLKHGPREDE